MSGRALIFQPIRASGLPGCAARRSTGERGSSSSVRRVELPGLAVTVNSTLPHPHAQVTSVPSMHSPSRPKVSWRPGTRFAPGGEATVHVLGLRKSRRVRSMFGTSPLLLRYLRGYLGEVSLMVAESDQIIHDFRFWRPLRASEAVEEAGSLEVSGGLSLHDLNLDEQAVTYTRSRKAHV